MVCLTSWGSQGLPVYTVGARGWHPDRGLSLGKVLGAILHGVVERKRGSRGGDDVDIGGIGWVDVNVDSSFTPDPLVVSDVSRLRARRV